MLSFLTAILTIPLLIFVVFILPIWLVLHYRSKRALGQGLSTQEIQNLQTLTERAEKLQQRVYSLERILEQESPDWRNR